jgi:hypothetical protein
MAHPPLLHAGGDARKGLLPSARIPHPLAVSFAPQAGAGVRRVPSPDPLARFYVRISLHQHDVNATRAPISSLAWRVWIRSGHFLEFNPFVIALFGQLSRDDDMALALVVAWQPLEMTEPQFDGAVASGDAAL